MEYTFFDFLTLIGSLGLFLYRSVNYRSYTIFFRNDGDGCQFCKCRLTFFDTVGVGYYGCQCGYYRNGVDNFYFWL